MATANHGMDTQKLKNNLDALLSGRVADGQLPCVQAMVFRRGAEVYSGAFGFRDLESKDALTEDAIFRIYSMSKVFTSVSAMMLFEQGKFKMHDPLSKFFPAFEHSRVVQHGPSGQISYVKPNRPIIIRDLFTMASGVPYGGGETISEKAVMDVWARMERDEKNGVIWDVERYMAELAKVPLNFHPGDHWWYGYSIDLLGMLVEKLSGMKLGEFMKARIFDPLGLVDTDFFVPQEKLNRFVTMYEGNPGGFRPVGAGHPEYDPYMARPAIESGGGGLVSTARDVGIFIQMLANLGELNGVRILSRRSVELMRTNHLSAPQLIDYDWDTQRGYGYGLGVRVMMHPEIAGYGNVGEFAWDGMAGTWFMADPAEQLSAVFLVQTNPGNHYHHVPYFAQAVYGAIAD